MTAIQVYNALRQMLDELESPLTNERSSPHRITDIDQRLENLFRAAGHVEHQIRDLMERLELESVQP